VLTQVADDVFVHQSEFMQSNAVVVRGADGVLVVDAGVRRDELACLAHDVDELGRQVVAGFSTHPHWDHLLWDDCLGDVPRYATARCAATASGRLSDPGARARVVSMMPPELADRVPLDQLGRIDSLPAGAADLPWDGPRVRVLEHQAHAPGHAALVIESCGVLVAGDMLSDLLVPMLDLSGAADPIGDYLAGLDLLDGLADGVDVVVPGHGSVGTGEQVRVRIEQDRGYLHVLRAGESFDDPRMGRSPNPGVHERQQQLSRR
jgi:glyoxylase-like metal-dependent hydrolase (beta-lactamase superfamily II)